MTLLAAFDPLAALMVLLGLGGLIFFHELGHFIACRLTGTRVEAFSVGFGPKIFGWRRGATLYKIGAIPLGGYVKMAVENPGERGTGAPDELPSKSFLQRLFIFTAGVLFNVILGFALFAWAFGIGIPFPKPLIGAVEHGSPAWESDLRPGDLITHVEGRPVLSFEDVGTEVAFRGGGEPLTLTILRDGAPHLVSVDPRYSPIEGFARIGIRHGQATEPTTVLGGSPVEKAGGQQGDKVIALDGAPVADLHALGTAVAAALRAAPPEATSLDSTLRVARSVGGETDLRVTVPLKRVPLLGVTPHESPVVRAIVIRSATSRLLRRGDEILAVNGTAIRDLGLARAALQAEAQVEEVLVRRAGSEERLIPAEPLTVQELLRSVAGVVDEGGTVIAPQPGSAAAEAGLEPGDRIEELAGQEVRQWAEMVARLAEHGAQPLAVRVTTRGGGSRTVTVTLRSDARYADDEKFGYALGYTLPPLFGARREANVLSAMSMGWSRTLMTLETVTLALRGLLTQRVSAKHVGGPITLATQSYSMWEQGLARFLYILALISINLAILNILPIPILDGGQVVLLIVEKIRGKPLPERVVGAFQMVGLALILGLVALAFTNDITNLLR
ncbi:MAG: RIP metalloprotease RseP [Planctomycetaceae bacterium]